MDHKHPDLERILVSSSEINRRIKELAVEIERDYSQVERLYMVGILKGAFIFMADLTRQLKLPHVVDFMALSSYGKSTEFWRGPYFDGFARAYRRAACADRGRYRR